MEAEVTALNKLSVKRFGRVCEGDQTKDDAMSAFEFKPLPIGWFTLDGDGNYRGECEEFVKYLYLPSLSVNFNLNKYHKDDKYDFDNVGKMYEHIDPLLHWVKENSTGCPESDFICYRNVFASLLKTPYECNADLFLCGVKLRGSIYLCKFASERKKKDEGRFRNKWSVKHTKQGYKFQQYVLTDTPGEAPDMSQPLVRDKQCTFVVMRASAGPHSLLYASKSKCVSDRETVLDLESASLVDFKTYYNDNYKWYKLLDWWSSSITGKVDRMIIGLRGDYGLMREVKIFDVATLLRKTHEEISASGGERGRSRGGFHGNRDADVIALSEGSELVLHNRCFNFLSEFLTFVKDTMKDDTGPEVVFQFEWSPKANENFVNCTKFSGEASKPFRFIPEWYMEWLDSQLAL